jgi:hypothetical protein
MERVKRRIFAGFATCALACGATTAVAPAAGAATTECGSACSTWMVYEYSPDLVLNATGDAQGSIVTLAEKGNDKGEDFEFEASGTTTEFYEDGIIAAALAAKWPTYEMYEYQYTPDGQPSGLCVGTASTASDSTGLVLEPCGVDAETLWLPLPDESYGGFEPIVAGTDINLTAPYVMTAGRFESQVGTYQLASGEPTSQLWIRLGGVL